MRRLRRQIFRQIVQGRRRLADARQGEFVQSDEKYASKMCAKREARALCGVALNLIFSVTKTEVKPFPYGFTPVPTPPPLYQIFFNPKFYGRF